MRSKQSVKTALAVTLALSAIAAPTAAAQGAQAGQVVRPNPDEQTAIVARTGSTAPSQSAPLVRSNPDQQTAAVAQHSSGYSSPNDPPSVSAFAPAGGFDWGDAGIGAVGGFALSVLALGLVLVVSRRARDSKGSATIAS